MFFKKNQHKINLYNILLKLSRNKFFYEKIVLKDTGETRIYLMFFHFSILMIIFKKKGKKLDQYIYDYLFHNIENNLRELGYGDVSVNKKMKDLNKILYDILLKIEKTNNQQIFDINYSLTTKYFREINEEKSDKFINFRAYFLNFYNFCFDLSLENVIREIEKYRY